MFIHQVPNSPIRQDVLNSRQTSDYQLRDGTNMRCVTPELFEDAVNSIIFSTFLRLFYPHDADMLRKRVESNEVRPADVWLPTNQRQRVLVALYTAGCWDDVVRQFEFQLDLLPYSKHTKTILSNEFFATIEPDLKRVCADLSQTPGYIATATTSTVYQPHR